MQALLVRWQELVRRLGPLRPRAGRAALALLLLGAFGAVLLWRLAAADAGRKDAMLDLARTEAGRREAGLRSALDETRGQANRDQAEIAGLRRQLQQVREERAELAGRMQALGARAAAPLGTDPEASPGLLAGAAPGPAAELPPAARGRRLTQAQYAQVARSAQGNGQALTVAVSAGAEAHAYGDQIAAALSEAGYEVTVADYDFKPPEHGLMVARIDTMQDDTARLEARLRSAGIAFRPAAPSWSNGVDATMRLEIRVGAAP